MYESDGTRMIVRENTPLGVRIKEMQHMQTALSKFKHEQGHYVLPVPMVYALTAKLDAGIGAEKFNKLLEKINQITDPEQIDYLLLHLNIRKKSLLPAQAPVQSSVVVTAPHATCDAYSSLDHMCDSTAERMARLLRADHVFVNTDVSRRVLDMNRPESRDTAFRRAISATPARVLIDVHSFPSGSFGDADFVIMEPDPEPTPAIQLLIDRFRRTDLVGRWVQGSPVNSILAVAREQGITASFLLEVKEELSGDQMKRLADVINGWAGIV